MPRAVLLNRTRPPGGSRLPLAGVPLLLRALLAAQRVGVEEVLVVGGQDPSDLLKRTRRLKLAWRWLPEVEGVATRSEVGELLRAGREVEGEFLLLFADSIFDVSAIRALRELDLEGRAARAAAATPITEPAAASGLYVCGPDFLRLAEQAAREGVGSIDDLFARAQARGQAAVVEVEGRVWPRTTDPEQLRSIGQELAHVSIKPSDGFYARFNKRVLSLPLITLFLNTPATPNFITGLGLTLALTAAVVIAQGGYWWALGGSVLWFLSALMDHCDGMVARLKFMESDFGTWFESTVDNTATLAVYVGLAVGLYRETGFTHHLLVGGLFVVGTIISFLAMSLQRKRISGDNLADYPNRMHRKLEAHSSNPFLWFGRNAYFIARRAVLPYYVLLFCLLDLRVFFLGWSALGAQLYWIMTLYSNRMLRPAPVPKAAEGD